MSTIVKFDTKELNVIEKSKAEQIKKTFDPMVKMLEGFEAAYNEVVKSAENEVTEEVTKKAKRLRLDIGRVRIDADKVRKSEKDEYLRAGQAIQGVFNILKWAVSDREDKLKEIENHFEIQEQKRVEALQAERADALFPYVEHAHDMELSGMAVDVWDAYFQAKKKDHFDQIEAHKKAEKERIAAERAEALERERMRKENDRLKKEAEARELAARKEAEAREKAARAEAEARRIKEEAERKQREAKERKEREEYEARLRQERQERERLEAEIKAKEAAEIKSREEAEARVQADLNKGDVAKVKDLADDLRSIKTKYSFKSAKNKKMYSDVSVLIDKIIIHINK